jgi:hypothetical protein
LKRAEAAGLPAPPLLDQDSWFKSGFQFFGEFRASS